jgi:predicted O-methyltransferase YrrM
MPIPTLTTRATTDPTTLYRYRDGIYAADLITAAIVHFDFFSVLAERRATLGEVCETFGFAKRPADVLLTLATAAGLLEHQHDRYSVTDMAREHIVSGSPFYLAPYFASLAERPAVSDFTRVLRTGQPAHWGAVQDGHDWHTAMEDETFARGFTDAMDCRGLLLAQSLAATVNLNDRKRLLDIGGGSGIYACVLAAHFPALRAVVFDKPPVDRIAGRLIAERECDAQVEVRPGSFFDESAWPGDCDVHLFSNVLHDWGQGDVERLLAISYRQLPPGGLLVIHDAFINADKTGPLPVAEYSAILMHSTQGKCYATSEYEHILTALGFRDISYRETTVDRGVMTARKADD